MTAAVLAACEVPGEVRSGPKHRTSALCNVPRTRRQEDTMITCFIRYELDPYKRAQFDQYAKTWGQAIPRCGADLIGYFSPHEGSSTIGYGVYNIDSLAAYEAYRARLAADPLGRENYEFAQRERFILREDRIFLKNVSVPHAEIIKP
jgi:NIPSNAP